MKIAIFGGSFNPIHIGHLINASFAIIRGGMDKVIFLPSGNHPFKDPKLFVDGTMRLNMVKTAIEGDARFSVSDYELSKEGMTYTYDTMIFFKELYPNDELYFLIGSDLLKELPLWHKIEELSRVTTFLVENRYDGDTKTIAERVEELERDFNMHFKLITLPYITISSSEIRDMISKGQCVKYMVTKEVLKIIEENMLYV